MKKLITLLLAAALALSCAAALADSTPNAAGSAPGPMDSAALAAAFDADALELMPVELPAPTAESFDIPDAYWSATGIAKPDDVSAWLEAFLSESTLTLVSLSPNGGSGLYQADGYVSEGEVLINVCFCDGAYHIMYPAFDKSAEDTYGNFAALPSRSITDMLGDEGVTYSPDGRYAVMFNWQNAFVYYKGADLVLTDLSTGEMILIETFTRKIGKPGFGSAYAGCFSADGRYLYYMVHEQGPVSTSLKRYDTATGEVELCIESELMTMVPAMAETPDGELIIGYALNSSKGNGIATMSDSGAGWELRRQDFDIDAHRWYAYRLLSKAATGYAVVNGRRKDDTLLINPGEHFIKRFRLDADLTGIGDYIAISNLDDKPVVISAAEYLSELDKVKYGTADDTPPITGGKRYRPYHIISAMWLSPDGQYLLMHTSASENCDAAKPLLRRMYLLRIEDLTLREVRGLDMSDQTLMGAASVYYRPIIEWNCDTLIIRTRDGINTYRFK